MNLNPAVETAKFVKRAKPERQFDQEVLRRWVTLPGWNESMLDPCFRVVRVVRGFNPTAFSAQRFTGESGAQFHTPARGSIPSEE